jgi:hypothetical protein
MKALLWLDTLYRATSVLHDVTYLQNRAAFDATQQTIGFWAYLDATETSEDYEGRDDVWVGERYVQYHAAASPLDPTTAAAYEARVGAGWIHPTGRVVLDRWRKHYSLLGLHDPGLFQTNRPRLGLDDLTEELASADLVLDLRPIGGSLYLDLTHEGLPLRSLRSADGKANHLAFALRELLERASGYDSVVLLCDDDMAQDYRLIQRVLQVRGHDVHRLALGRVPIDGITQSSRKGGWQGFTVDKLLEPLLRDHAPRAVQLGTRLYFVAGLGRSGRQSFRADLLQSFVRKAETILERCGGAGPSPLPGRALRCLERAGCYVDPYGVVSLLLSPHVDDRLRATIVALLLGSRCTP